MNFTKKKRNSQIAVPLFRCPTRIRPMAFLFLTAPRQVEVASYFINYEQPTTLRPKQKNVQKKQ